MTPLPTLDDLNQCEVADFVAHLAEVWEHAPWVAEAAAAQRPFDSVDSLHRTMLEVVTALPGGALQALLAGHPDLAGADARSGRMTAASTGEQGALALDALAADDAARWDELNAHYRARNGFPFILCVRRHTRASVLRCFEQRLRNDRATELRLALDEIGRVTRLRLAARVRDHGLQNISGRLTTHVLDTSRGQPAAGMRLSLHECGAVSGAAEPRQLAEAVTDHQGQTASPLIAGEPLRIGRYEMRFHVGDYYRDTGAPQGDWPFLDVVPVVFCIAEPEGDYHVPLTVTPWAYATYRGQ